MFDVKTEPEKYRRIVHKLLNEMNLKIIGKIRKGNYNFIIIILDFNDYLLIEKIIEN